MVGGIPLHPAGNIVSEVIRQTTDDAYDRGQVTGGQAADVKHDVILHHLGPAAGHLRAWRWPAIRLGRFTGRVRRAR